MRVRHIVLGSLRSALQASVLAGALSLLTAVPAPAETVRLTEENAKILQKVPPAYPPIARQMHLSGKVVLDMTVAEDGGVEKVDVVSGSPILSSGASAAAMKWKFQPVQADGKPAKAIVRITFNFTAS